MARYSATADQPATARPSQQAARTNLLGQVHATYVESRGRAMSTTTVRLRWLHRRWSRHADHLDQLDLARLHAVRDELRDRGCLPS